jgi:hypothetical protein
MGVLKQPDKQKPTTVELSQGVFRNRAAYFYG